MTMREKFEAWAADNIGRLWRNHQPGYADQYEDFTTQNCWKSWQAAYAAGMTRAAEIAQFGANGWMRTKGGGERHEEALTISDAIRAEIKGK
jgi:hypothetical protein